ncbi:hypothetical protein CBM2599_B50166 [Cupriavidus taiwanensis]|uniref:Uncharacterized protein n=1 Tax=Cupriavidus taiwanensis TaxID=164546 RepID=A0A375D4E5_9BURK|nr:hypothetical protein CBM2600_B10822 [Cupriavidus taiwanensis]SOY96175.1 hypothetical protein CBM2599_B50166 [Cupriavidus taiwanensis]SPD69088.1 protein of unknown function [Cupriavidus taiwanensis]
MDNCAARRLSPQKQVRAPVHNRHLEPRPRTHFCENPCQNVPVSAPTSDRQHLDSLAYLFLRRTHFCDRSFAPGTHRQRTCFCVPGC